MTVPEAHEIIDVDDEVLEVTDEEWALDEMEVEDVDVTFD